MHSYPTIHLLRSYFGTIFPFLQKFLDGGETGSQTCSHTFSPHESLHPSGSTIGFSKWQPGSSLHSISLQELHFAMQFFLAISTHSVPGLHPTCDVMLESVHVHVAVENLFSPHASFRLIEDKSHLFLQGKNSQLFSGSLETNDPSWHCFTSDVQAGFSQSAGQVPTMHGLSVSSFGQIISSFSSQILFPQVLYVELVSFVLFVSLVPLQIKLWETHFFISKTCSYSQPNGGSGSVSTMHDLHISLHESPFAVLLSSHSSVGSTNPFPQVSFPQFSGPHKRHPWADFSVLSHSHPCGGIVQDGETQVVVQFLKLQLFCGSLGTYVPSAHCFSSGPHSFLSQSIGHDSEVSFVSHTLFPQTEGAVGDALKRYSSPGFRVFISPFIESVAIKLVKFIIFSFVLRNFSKHL